MAQRVLAQAVDQAVGGAGIEQAQVIGQDRVIGGAVTGQVVLQRLDDVLVLTAGAIQVTVQRLRARIAERGDYDAWVATERHHLGLEYLPVGFGPGACLVVEVVIQPYGAAAPVLAQRAPSLRSPLNQPRR